MDIRKILKENAFGGAAAYTHLSALQIGILKKIASDSFTPDPSSVSPKVQDALDELIGFGLLNVDFSITQAGLTALKYADRMGGSVERRHALANKEKAFNTNSNDNFNDID
jgi:hypothetical protein